MHGIHRYHNIQCKNTVTDSIELTQHSKVLIVIKTNGWSIGITYHIHYTPLRLLSLKLQLSPVEYSGIETTQGRTVEYSCRNWNDSGQWSIQELKRLRTVEYIQELKQLRTVRGVFDGNTKLSIHAWWWWFSWVNCY